MICCPATRDFLSRTCSFLGSSAVLHITAECNPLTAVFGSGRLDLQLAPPIQTCLVDPGRLLALEEPPREGRRRAGVAAAQVDLESEVRNPLIKYRKSLDVTSSVGMNSQFWWNTKFQIYFVCLFNWYIKCNLFPQKLHIIYDTPGEGLQPKYKLKSKIKNWQVLFLYLSPIIIYDAFLWS